MGRMKELWAQQQEEAYHRELQEEESPAPYHTAKPYYANRISAVKPTITKTTAVNTGEEILTVNPTTGEIIVTGSKEQMDEIQQTKVAAFKLLKHNDFVNINGTWEAKRDGLLKILTSLPISYNWKIKAGDINDTHAYVHGELVIAHGDVIRSAEAMGICERSELRGNGGLHFMNARAETRALKRAIETLFGSVINYYVIHHLEAA
jgi:hypothetical protein